MEDIVGTIVAGDMAGASLSISQKSVERFSDNLLENPYAVALQGVSRGEMTIAFGSNVVLIGSYVGQVSNGTDALGNSCQFLSVGHWNAGPDSPVRGKGTFESCLNFNPDFLFTLGVPPFVGTVSLEGRLKD